MLRMTVRVLLLLWSSAAAAQETTQWNWDVVRDSLKKHAVEVEMSGTRNDVVSISMTKTDTVERGLFEFEWDRRQEADLKLFEIENDLFVVLSVEGSTSLKPPLGTWHTYEEGVPGFHEGNWLVEAEETRGFEPMFVVGDRIRGNIRDDSDQP